MHSTAGVKTLVQCDFDGTITQKDVSFLLLDAYSTGDWRQLLAEYREGRIPVGYFNMKAFAMIKTDRQTLINLVRREVKLRAGVKELLDFCYTNGFELVIVSNGLDFYIKTILGDIGIDNVKVFAAQTNFTAEGIEAKYIGPEGNQIQEGFKESYTRVFLSQGYRVIYVGNGISDIDAARLSHHIFATEDLLACCKKKNINCTPFADLNDVVRGLKLL